MFRTKLMPYHKSCGFRCCQTMFGILLFLSLLVLTGCSIADNADINSRLVDKSFVNSELCSPPCWYGLVIDKSTKADVLTKLDQLPFIVHEKYREYSTVWNDDNNAKEIQFDCVNFKYCGGALISNNKLKRLWLRVGYDLTLKEVVDKIGIPDFLDYGIRIQGGCKVDLWWLKHGLVIESIDEKTDEECQNISTGNGITPQKLVSIITYFSQGSTVTPGDCCKRITWPGFAK
jgi:hypothetical protein